MLSQGPSHSALAQQVQQRIRRTIRQVFQIIRLRACKLIIGMKTRNLKTPCPAVLFDERIGEIEELVVVGEFVQ